MSCRFDGRCADIETDDSLCNQVRLSRILCSSVCVLDVTSLSHYAPAAQSVCEAGKRNRYSLVRSRSEAFQQLRLLCLCD